MQNNLIRLRKEAGLSQEELADKLAVSRQAVSKWERGEALPDTDNLIRLARLYNVSIDEIVGYAPEKETSADENKVAGADGAKETDNASGADGAKAAQTARKRRTTQAAQTARTTTAMPTANTTAKTTAKTTNTSRRTAKRKNITQKRKAASIYVSRRTENKNAS